MPLAVAGVVNRKGIRRALCQHIKSVAVREKPDQEFVIVGAVGSR